MTMDNTDILETKINELQAEIREIRKLLDRP